MDDRKRSNIITDIAKLKRQIGEVAAAAGGGVSGVPGACGVSGVPGAVGACGVSGVSGIPGACGVSGIPGACGVSGTAGVAGACGVSGVAGACGISGVAGTAGACGVSGVAGACGVSGTAGAAGACGVSGTAGAAGACGVSGVAGTAGACGVSGVAGTAGACGVSGVAGACGVSGTAGVAGACGVSGVSGISGVPGRDAGIKYTYLTDTANSDPGSGKIKFNSATLASINTVRISETDGDGNAIAALLATFDDSTTTAHRGILTMIKDGAPANILVLDVTSALTDNGTWDNFTVAFIASSGTFANNDTVKIFFDRTGDQGACGISGVAGACGVSGTAGTNGACGVSGVSGAGVDSLAWSTWTPTVTSSAGAITTVGAVAGRYKQIGKTIIWRATIVITTAGAGNGGTLQFTVPVTAKDATSHIGSGREQVVIGKGMAVWLGSTTRADSNYTDNTGPVATSASYQLSGSYEAA